jgi:hypothetical protein
LFIRSGKLSKKITLILLCQNHVSWVARRPAATVLHLQEQGDPHCFLIFYHTKKRVSESLRSASQQLAAECGNALLMLFVIY